jgi:hypothetical protein
LTQLSYLRDYGLAPATKRAVIVFYEGNDLVDLNQEYNHLIRYRETGERPHRDFRKETSLVRAIYQLATKRPKMDVNELLIGVQPKSWLTGYFKSSDGDIPITLRNTPPSRDQISPETMKQLEYFFEQFAAFGKAHGIEVWSAFMPCKERVVNGMVEFVQDAPEEEKQWRPTNLPQVISDLAIGHGVRFMDFTPAFVRETREKRELLFNSIYDSHLNTKGSRLVASEMARFLSRPD